jgi:hypothetical protein
LIHEENRALESVWQAAAEGRADAPHPAPGLLAHAFVAQRWDEDHYAFIHAGAALSQIHGRRLLDQNLLSLWRREDRRELKDALEESVRQACPLIVRGRGRRLDGGAIEFEATFWPLVGPSGSVDRILGALAPCVGASGDRPVIEHAIDEISLLPRDSTEPAPRSRELARLLVSEMQRARRIANGEDWLESFEGAVA